jgi:predicted RNA binding protein YcfA (HicA-like mRNA interferase family)
MGRLPVLKSREVMRLLHQHGFSLIRQRGSHCQFKHPDGRQTTVPDHRGRDLSPPLLRQIIKDIGMPIDEFLDI